MFWWKKVNLLNSENSYVEMSDSTYQIKAFCAD